MRHCTHTSAHTGGRLCLSAHTRTHTHTHTQQQQQQQQQQHQQQQQVHNVSSTLVQAAVYQQNLHNLTLLVGFIHAHRHAQDVMTQHIKVWCVV
jgi:hypothetical protein